MIRISQFNGQTQKETLQTALDFHAAGLREQLPYDDSTVFAKVHLHSLVMVGDDESVIDSEFENISTADLITEFTNALRAIWEPGYDPDVIVGAGTTTIIRE